MTVQEYLDQLIVGNASVINNDTTKMLNETAMELYRLPELTTDEIATLKALIMSCNILYNRTDMTVLPIEDGVYDLLLEKYKKYDPNFQVGSAVIAFRNFVENDVENPRKVAISPIIFNKVPERNEVQQSMYESIMRNNEPVLVPNDFHISPIQYTQNPITKRVHDTKHNHPSLVGTLDKAKFIYMKDAIAAGVANDPNVVVLERDFFYDHIKKGLYRPNDVIEVVVELKYDGISVEADCGLEVESARTRGDTGIGEAADISPILMGYTFHRAGCMIGQKPIGVKFEAIMTKSDLQTFNQLKGRNYSNCRTAIVGLFGSSDAYLYRDLITLIPLAVDRDDLPQIANRKEEIDFLNRIFVTHGEPLRHCFMTGTVTEILYFIKAFYDEAKLARDYLDFMFDGIVVSYVDERICQTLGRKNYINKYSMAVKFDPIEKITTFRGYTFEVGQDGRITPMIHYDPVEFLGTIHTKSSGHSYSRFQELELHYGDLISVTYVNDVMPYVNRMDCEQNRRNTNPPVPFISKCPICGSKLIVSESNKSIFCPNLGCPGRSIQRMVNMFAKLNIKGFAESTFMALKKDHLYEVVDLDLEYLKSVLGEADGTAFWTATNQLKTEPLPDYLIMGALGFTGLAQAKWKAVLELISVSELDYLYHTLADFAFMDAVRAVIMSIKGIGASTAITVVNEFPFFEKDIACILSWGNLIDSKGVKTKSLGQIRFSGIRNKELADQLTKMGYDANENASVTKKTDLLLVPYEGFISTKTRKAPPTCKVVPIDKFLADMDKYLGRNL